MKRSIDKFIEKNTCANICCVDANGNPYCFSCFYCYDKDNTLLYYKTEAETHHSVLMQKHHAIAGTILPDKLNILKIKGIQFEGQALQKEHPLANNASYLYYKKHPIALTMLGEIWTIQINSIKFTDNTLGFGTKLNWKRQQ